MRFIRLLRVERPLAYDRSSDPDCDPWRSGFEIDPAREVHLFGRASCGEWPDFFKRETDRGLKCLVRQNNAGGGDILMRKASPSISYSLSGPSGRSVMEFSIREAGEYRFACEHEAEANGPGVALAVGTGVGEQISKTLMFSLMSMFAGIGALGIVAVCGADAREGTEESVDAAPCVTDFEFRGLRVTSNRRCALLAAFPRRRARARCGLLPGC